MNTPRYIMQGLKAIDGLYFAVFNPRIKEEKSMSYGRGRWQVRKWVGNRPRRLDLWDIESTVIMTICKEEMTDEGLVDAGYEDIDIRVVTAIGKSNHWKAQWKEKIADMDWKNERKERQAEEQLEYEAKYVAARVWRSMHEPTINLDGQCYRWKK